MYVLIFSRRFKTTEVFKKNFLTLPSEIIMIIEGMMYHTLTDTVIIKVDIASKVPYVHVKPLNENISSNEFPIIKITEQN